MSDSLMFDICGYICFFSASLMKNTGTLFANDANKDRSKAVVGNVHRLGVTNTVICNYDGRTFPKVNLLFSPSMK